MQFASCNKKEKFAETLRFFNITSCNDSTFNNIAYFTNCSDWFASKRFLNKLIFGYFRQNKVNMTDVSTIVAKYCFTDSNPSFFITNSDKTPFTLFLPTNCSHDDYQGKSKYTNRKACDSYYSNIVFNHQIVKIGVKPNENTAPIHIGIIGIQKQNKNDLLDTLNQMKRDGLYFGVFF